MSNEKKDLTRIEDLGEFIHELNSTTDFTHSEDFSSEVPDLPLPEEQEATTSSEIDFSTAEDFTSESPEESNSLDFEESFEQEQGNNFESDFSETTQRESETVTSFETPEEASPTEWSLEEPKEETQRIPEPVEVTEPIIQELREFKAPENFADLKNFSENTSLNVGLAEGNPSFSLLIKNVRFIEDINDIVSLLNDFKLLIDSEEQTRARLMRGVLLVPRVSEFTAIFLAHKLRRFDIDIEVGLSDEIHPPKHQEKPETGIVSKHSLYQNQIHSFNFENPKLDISDIIVSASPTLEGHQVVRYLGVASEHKIVGGAIVEDESSEEVIRLYHEMAQKLKAHALKANSNAVVGLNYQLTPLPSDFGVGGHKYRLSCTGNLVWVNKL